MAESVGSRLKKLRLEKGLTLEEVHKKTKIHLNILKSIEEEGLLNLSPIYIKGFLKIYAKFLGLDPKDSVTVYSKETKNIPLAKQPEPKKNSPSFFETTSVKLISWRPNQKTKIAFIYAVIFMASFIILFNIGKNLSRRRVLMPKVKKQRIQAVQPVKVKPKPAEISPVKPVVSVSGINLGILARADCWITLKVDGRLVFRSVLKKGKSENWQAKERIEVSLNKPGAVDLVVNGERLLPSARGAKAPKNITITKEGIKFQ